jgi:benzoyl-CoA reductase subunit C
MEEELAKLIDRTTEANRKNAALEWKKQGKPVIGVMSSYVPEEVITAAGMLPWRIAGTFREDLEAARVYRGDSTCSYCNHVLELFLNGELDFLDGVIVTDLDQDLLRLWDLLVYMKKPAFNYAIHIPFVDSGTTRGFFADEISRLIEAIETQFNTKISETSLNSAIETHNRTRSLVRQIYELRKREIPPLSGTEVLGITSAAEIMPKAEFNHTLETLMPNIEQRHTDLAHVRPRILITGESLDNPAYLKLVEEQCIIVMDDTDTGSRSFIQDVDAGTASPETRLAARYLSRPGDPRMIDWDKQADQIIQWVKDYNADGVLAMPLIWCYPQRYRMPYLFGRLDEAGIPHASLEREYHFTNAGQLRTRIGAFLEMLDTRQNVSIH